MKKQTWTIYLFCILFAEAVGAFSGWLTRDGIVIFNEAVNKPPLSPPALVFPIVWSLLYALMGLGIARIVLKPKSAEQTRSKKLFLLQLFVNFLWSPVFFNLQAYGAALLWLLLLWVLVLLMIISFRKTDPIAAYLQIPYLIWLTFATYLNFGVWVLNA